MFKTLPSLATLVTITLQRLYNCLKEFLLLSVYTCWQAFLRVLKFFRKGHSVFPSNILSEAAIERCSMVQGLTILKKHQEELNWYLLSTTAIHRKFHVNFICTIQPCNMRTILLAFVLLCHEVLEWEVIYNWANEK